MTRLYDKIVIAAFVAAICAPVAARLADVGDRKVVGALLATPRPELTFRGVRDESFQTTFTNWFENALPLKGYSIATDNTILYHLANDTKPNSTVRIGDDDVLFLYEDLAYYNARANEAAVDRFDRFATKLAALQARLVAEHRALIPLIVPSKTSIYRDKVPARLTRDPGEPRASDELVYRGMRRALDAHHVRYVDARELLETSNESREVLWPTVGRHWTRYGACLAFAEVARAYTELTGRPLEIQCVLERIRGLAGHLDYDLYRLMNAWWIRHPREAIDVAEMPSGAGARPSVMFVGTSFGWNLWTVAQRTHQVDAFMDYYDNWVLGPNEMTIDLHSSTHAWRDAMLDKDLYALELFETYIGAPQTPLEQVPDELAAALR